MGTHYKAEPQVTRALDAYIKLMRAAETLTSILARDLAAEGLTTTQFGVLEVLLHLGPRCQKDMGHKLLKSGGNITTVLANLERRGLVHRVRDPDDRRFVEVSLTDTGRALIEHVFPPHAERIAKLMRALSTSEQDGLAELCKSLGVAAAAER
jgi:MarR family transcriptional regulator, 2-MHQ and catechol-resistance regulon repressor